MIEPHFSISWHDCTHRPSLALLFTLACVYLERISQRNDKLIIPRKKKYFYIIDIFKTIKQIVKAEIKKYCESKEKSITVVQ